MIQLFHFYGVDWTIQIKHYYNDPYAIRPIISYESPEELMQSRKPSAYKNTISFRLFNTECEIDTVRGRLQISMISPTEQRSNSVWPTHPPLQPNIREFWIIYFYNRIFYLERDIVNLRMFGRIQSMFFSFVINKRYIHKYS